VGNALGSYIGGLAISAGLGYVSPIWIGAGSTGLALILLAFAISWQRVPTAIVKAKQLVVSG